MINGIIFDADGTLLDSMGFWESTVFDVLKMAGVDDRSPKLIEALTPMTITESAAYLKKNYGIKLTAEEMIAREHQRIIDFYEREVELLPGMGALLEELAMRRIPMAIATATQRYMIEMALRKTGIYDKFVGVISCSDVGAGKNKPDVFLKACELTGTTPQTTLVVEDSRPAAETAEKAGFKVVLVNENTYKNVMNFFEA